MFHLTETRTSTLLLFEFMIYGVLTHELFCGAGDFESRVLLTTGQNADSWQDSSCCQCQARQPTRHHIADIGDVERIMGKVHHLRSFRATERRPIVGMTRPAYVNIVLSAVRYDMRDDRRVKRLNLADLLLSPISDE